MRTTFLNKILMMLLKMVTPTQQLSRLPTPVSTQPRLKICYLSQNYSNQSLTAVLNTLLMFSSVASLLPFLVRMFYAKPSQAWVKLLYSCSRFSKLFPMTPNHAAPSFYATLENWPIKSRMKSSALQNSWSTFALKSFMAASQWNPKSSYSKDWTLPTSWLVLLAVSLLCAMASTCLCKTLRFLCLTNVTNYSIKSVSRILNNDHKIDMRKDI